MRIITGSARGTNLQTLEGLATRPTGAKVKEALFSMLQFDVEGRRVLDLFAGSGQLGLEALSRGAEHAVFIDSSREAADIVIANAKKTHLFEKCRVSVTDYAAFLKSAAAKNDKFHLIFLDPPYASDSLAKALELISGADICTPGAIIACESETEAIFGDKAEVAANYTILKQSRYGRVYITLLSPKTEQ